MSTDYTLIAIFDVPYLGSIAVVSPDVDSVISDICKVTKCVRQSELEMGPWEIDQWK